MARRKALDRILAALKSDDPRDRVRALERLGAYRFQRSHAPARQRKQAIDAVLAALARDGDEGMRLKAAYELNFWTVMRGTGARIGHALLDVLEDDAEMERTRAQAGESAAAYVSHGAGTPALRKRATDVLTRLLDHPSAEIRFWCIYAVGQAQMVEARAALERIAVEDDGLCPGMWRVRDEAADVLGVLDGRDWPDRSPLV